MLTVATWLWGSTFSAAHVNALQAGLRAHLAMPFELVCITNQPDCIHPDVRIVPMPMTYAQTPRCRRRMQGFSAEFASQCLGRRILYVDLDMVIVGDLTPIVDRPEPLVMWKVQHAEVFSGSCLLANAGALGGAWQKFQREGEAWPNRLTHPSAGRGSVASDQAMLNDYLKGQVVPHWTERDGFVTFYGKGYERFEHLGVGPHRRTLPPGARLVVLGSADLAEVTPDRYPWAAGFPATAVA